MQAHDKTDRIGIDVSHHQGLIDWTKVKASEIDFAYVKASQGLTMVDPQFRRNAGGANAVNIPVGFYHYANPEKGNTALAEAAHFLEVVKGQPCQLPYCLDLEGEAAKLSAADLTAWALAFMREVKKQTGKPVLLYTGAYFARDELLAAMSEFPLWIAHYGATAPLNNSTWKEWGVFQYSSTGKVAGIAGNVDMDYMDADYYAAITKPATPKPADKPREVNNVNDKLVKPMSEADANKVIKFLGAAHDTTSDPEAKAEYHTLANELRRVSNQPIQP